MHVNADSLMVQTLQLHTSYRRIFVCFLCILLHPFFSKTKIESGLDLLRAFFKRHRPHRLHVRSCSLMCGWETSTQEKSTSSGRKCSCSWHFYTLNWAVYMIYNLMFIFFLFFFKCIFLSKFCSAMK